MSRASTAGAFVFLVTLLGLFAILVNSIPPEFLVASQDRREVQTRTEWFPDENIGFLNYTDSGTITKGYRTFLEIGQITVDVHWVTYPYFDAPTVGIWFFHTWQVGFWWDWHTFDNMPITAFELEENKVEGHENRSKIVLTCPCPKTYYTYFIYNSTEYSSWSEAYEGGVLEVYVGMGWDDAIEKTNAWSLVWSILLFQAPEVFGTGPEAYVLNALIAVPLWAAFAITVVIITLWFIPLLGGE